MEIYILRHGQTVWNKEGRLQGSTDIMLNENGIEAAVSFGESIKDVHIDRIYSSPLKRAYDTACYIKGRKNIEIVKDKRIRELCFGAYEGRVMKEMEEDENCPFRHFFCSPKDYKPGEGGETLEELVLRATDFMKNEVEPLESKYERILIVAHGAMNKAILSYVRKKSIEDFWYGGLQKNCNAVIVSLKDGKYEIIKGE